MSLDPRHNSPTKLEAPDLLPHVSRRALARVKDWLPPPKVCYLCFGDVSLATHAEIYRGRSYGSWPFVYWCRACDAYVGLHPDTDIPLGILADESTREARKQAKALFNLVLVKFFGRFRQNARNYAYDWLCVRMNIPRNETHFAWFDFDRAELAHSICGDALRHNEAHGLDPTSGRTK